MISLITKTYIKRFYFYYKQEHKLLYQVALSIQKNADNV